MRPWLAPKVDGDTSPQHFRQVLAPDGRERSPVESVTTNCSIAIPEPAFARADPHRLQQCLTALVDNALLYTDGPVILTASSRPGVLPAEREAIFWRFVRGSGLSVVCLLIEAMGGRAQVAAHPGGGADVQAFLPVVQAMAGEANREKTEAVSDGTGVLWTGWVGGLSCGKWLFAVRW